MERGASRWQRTIRARSCWVEFSVGASFAHLDVHAALQRLPKAAWAPAYQARKPRAAETGVQIEPRDGAWVTEATGLVDLSGWPLGTRLILRKERPHPGRNCASPTPTARAADPADSSPTSSCGIADTPGWRTGCFSAGQAL